MKNPPKKLAVLAVIVAGAYIHGCRIITLEEVPSSHRPWGVYLTADYAKAHLTASSDEPDARLPGHSIFDVFGNN